jgi:hypothetical protein
MVVSLHPQNHRVGDEGIDEAIMAYLNYDRRPYLVVTDHGDHKHRTPLCPAVMGETWRHICYEEAVYVYGERWCATCRQYDLNIDDSWTDPRYRRTDS